MGTTVDPTSWPVSLDAIHLQATFKDEFVTAGGVDLRGVDTNRFESKTIPGIFFAGEVLDIDGITGGYNFQNAWSSSWCAGSAIALDAEQCVESTSEDLRVHEQLL